MAAIDDILTAARAHLDGALRTTSYEARGEMLEFMRQIGALGRALAGGAPRTPALDAFIAETAPMLARATVGYALWLGMIGDRILLRTPDDDDYEAVLRARSAIAFLRELYRGTPAEGGNGYEGTDDIDDQLREMPEAFRPTERPEGIPDDHWWWGV